MSVELKIVLRPGQTIATSSNIVELTLLDEVAQCSVNEVAKGMQHV